MTTIVKSSTEDVITLPSSLMAILDLQEGDEVKAVTEGHSLRLTPLDKFLALRGILREDKSFDEATEYLNRAWKLWKTGESV